MKDWKAYYKEHLTSMQDAAKAIKPGDVLWLGAGTVIPYGLLDEMYANMKDYHDVTLMYNVATTPFGMLFDTESKKHFRLISFFNLPLERMSGEMGVMEYHSCGYDQLCEGFFEYGGNTVAIHICPPDEDGYCNAGVYGVGTDSIIVPDPRVTKRIGIMDKGQVPVRGDRSSVCLHVTQFDYIIEQDTVMPEIPAASPTEVDKKIASYILPYIKKGDKIQIGFGGLGEEILANLHGLKDMEIFSEVACDNMGRLCEEGGISKITATSPGACTQEFYDFIQNESRVNFVPSGITVNLLEIMKQENLVAINATFMVDLLGQACSEAQGLKPYSGVGGSFAYIYGAILAKGGRSFLCLRATYCDKQGICHSNIVPWLPEGSIVSTPKNYQMYIVSEYGLADIYLKTVKDRIKALIKIAHPDFREELKAKICTTPLVGEDDFDGYELF